MRDGMCAVPCMLRLEMRRAFVKVRVAPDPTPLCAVLIDFYMCAPCLHLSSI